MSVLPHTKPPRMSCAAIAMLPFPRIWRDLSTLRSEHVRVFHHSAERTCVFHVDMDSEKAIGLGRPESLNTGVATRIRISFFFSRKDHSYICLARHGCSRALGLQSCRWCDHVEASYFILLTGRFSLSSSHACCKST
jgi:hypothetical protein